MILDMNRVDHFHLGALNIWDKMGTVSMLLAGSVPDDHEERQDMFSFVAAEHPGCIPGQRSSAVLSGAWAWAG